MAFVCEECGGNHYLYDYQSHTFYCPDCKATRQVLEHLIACPSCGEQIVSYTWFDPSGCPNCHHSFVD